MQNPKLTLLRTISAMKFYFSLMLGFSLAAALPSVVAAKTVWLDSLDISAATQDWGTPQKNKSVDGKPLTIGGRKFERGFGTHAESHLRIRLDGHARSFSAQVGIDGESADSARASVEFVVIGDGKKLWQSGVMRAKDAAKACEVDLTGVTTLVLQVTDANDGIDSDHADWANARFETDGGALSVVAGPLLPATPYILTPPAPHTPRINGANVFVVRPGSPFLYTIPATGDRPMTFSVAGLPKGLTLDSKTGRITGALRNKGEFTVTLGAKNALGAAEKKFRIVCGDRIALTPPLGWNSWNCFAGKVSADRVKRAANAMVSSGLIDHGWTYINIDDFWQFHRASKDPTLHGEFRDAQGFINPNHRFPDMKGLADYVHGLGLKIGIYSSPGPWTCGGCAASWRHERQDAGTYAKWGFDYLKYDWCSYGDIADGRLPAGPEVPLWSKANHRDVAMFPYAVMGKFIREPSRDIVYSLCQYGMEKVWEWGATVDGNCWRTTGDIIDTWKSMSRIGFNQDAAAPHSQPGHWNDPDMLVVGQVGWGNPHPSRLVPDEQYTHISLWCLLAAPLLIGCDMEKLDDFTRNLLCNDEVLAVDQDELGKGALCIIKNGDFRVYQKPLADGGCAIGFFNLGLEPLKMEFKDFARLNLTGPQIVRDLWRQKDVATVNTARDSLPLTIPAHGVVLYKFTAAK